MFFNSRNAYCFFSYFYISVGKIQYTQTHRHVSKLIYPILSSLCMHLFSSQFFFCNSNELIFFFNKFLQEKKNPRSQSIPYSHLVQYTGSHRRNLQGQLLCSQMMWGVEKILSSLCSPVYLIQNITFF